MIGRLAVRFALAQLAFLVLLIGGGEYAFDRGWLDPAFFGKPSGVALYLWKGLVVSRDLWLDLGYTLGGTLVSFAIGSVAAIATGALFVAFPRLEHAVNPYLTVINAMPRIALVPLFILWFGLGIGSKIAVGVSLTFFIVLSATTAGIRSVDADHLTLSRSLGARPLQLFWKVTLPSAVPVIFAGLRLGLIYAMLGVVGAELLAAEHGLGQTLALAQGQFNMDGVIALLLLLSLVGLLISVGMSTVERRLLKWR
jgi:NitT/TauT family transport system permease protein